MMNNSKSPGLSLEVTVYRVVSPSEFDALQLSTRHEIGRLEGFHAGLSLRGAEEPGLRADVALWTSLGVAREAAEVLMNAPRFTLFRGAVESVRHLAHYRAPSLETWRALGRGPVLEVAAYRSHPGTDMDGLQRAVHDALPGVRGMHEAFASPRQDGEEGHLDLIAWADLASIQAAPPQVMAQNPGVGPFFASIEETHVFDPFEVIRG
ncbi:MAG: hypothetical protein AAFZ18_25855 [Myxococcota bacterium]